MAPAGVRVAARDRRVREQRAQPAHRAAAGSSRQGGRPGSAPAVPVLDDRPRETVARTRAPRCTASTYHSDLQPDDEMPEDRRVCRHRRTSTEPPQQPARARRRARTCRHRAVVGDAEDRRLGIGVDRDDRLGGAHAGEVLDRAGDPEREVDAWLDGLARLANLARAGIQPASTSGRDTLSVAPSLSASSSKRGMLSLSSMPRPIESRKSALVMSTSPACHLAETRRARCARRGIEVELHRPRRRGAEPGHGAGAKMPGRSSQQRACPCPGTRARLRACRHRRRGGLRTGPPSHPSAGHVAREAEPARERRPRERSPIESIVWPSSTSAGRSDSISASSARCQTCASNCPVGAATVSTSSTPSAASAAASRAASPSISATARRPPAAP